MNVRDHRRLIAQKYDGTRHRNYPGRPRISPEVTELILRMARENRSWGYDCIAGALQNLGYSVSDQTVGNILRRFSMAPAPKRREQITWADLIRSHMAVLAGLDFFTVEVLTWRGLVTYYVLFFLHLETRRVTVAGITRHPAEEWMVQMARNAVDAPLLPVRFALHDREPSSAPHSAAHFSQAALSPFDYRRAVQTLTPLQNVSCVQSGRSVCPSSSCLMNSR